MKKIKLILIILLLFPFWLKAQNMDLERVERDISTASDILEALLKENRLHSTSNSSPVQGIYKENKGIVFSILGYVNRSFIYSSSFKSNRGNIKKQKITNNGVSITYRNGKKVKMTREEYNDSLKLRYLQRVEQLTEDFITNYAVLLSGIATNDSVKFIYQSNKTIVFYGEDKTTSPIEISVAKKDLDAFINGNTKEIKTKVVKNVIKLDKNYFQEFELTHNILQKKCNEYLAIKGGRNSFSYVREVGVTFWLGNKFYNGIRTTNRISTTNHISRTNHVSTTTIYRDNRIITKGDKIDSTKYDEKAFEKFQEKMTKDIIEYGRTLKNVQPDEFIFVKIPNLNVLSDFRDAPKNLEFVVRKSVLNDYNLQKLSLEEAIKKVEVKEY